MCFVCALECISCVLQAPTYQHIVLVQEVTPTLCDINATCRAGTSTLTSQQTARHSVCASRVQCVSKYTLYARMLMYVVLVCGAESAFSSPVLDLTREDSVMNSIEQPQDPLEDLQLHVSASHCIPNCDSSFTLRSHDGRYRTAWSV
jgi:hypothetical protein